MISPLLTLKGGCLFAEVRLPYSDHGSAKLPVWTNALDQERARELEDDGRNQEHGCRIRVVAGTEVQLLAQAGDFSIGEIGFSLRDGVSINRQQ